MADLTFELLVRFRNFLSNSETKSKSFDPGLKDKLRLAFRVFFLDMEEIKHKFKYSFEFISSDLSLITNYPLRLLMKSPAS